jgi:hypothetical protein
MTPITMTSILALAGCWVVPLGLVVLGAVAYAVYYAYQQHQKRLAALQAMAARLGLHFTTGQDHDHDDRFEQFAIFRQGTSRIAYNSMTGSTAVGPFTQAVVLGDFKYTVETGSGKNRRRVTRRFSYVLVSLPHAGVPELLLRSENFFDRIGNFFGFDDIDFESSEFSRRFHVSSSHKRFAWDLIDPRMMDFLMAETSPVIDLEEGWMCLADAGIWSPETFAERLDFAGRFLDHWPDHVVRGLDDGRYRELD